jgi:divalent metal cation (Fe/Co/Zn/Cd) transporter
MDAAPAGLERLISDEVKKVEGVEKIDRIRIRESGPRVFVDITAFIDKALPFEQAHGVTEKINERVGSIVPGSDIIVHAEPFSPQTTSLLDRIRSEASRFPEIKNIHNIDILEINNRLHIEFHIELEGNQPLSGAHEVMTKLESRITALDKNISRVSSHVEPIDNEACTDQTDGSLNARITRAIESIVRHHPEVLSFDIQSIVRMNSKYTVAIRCVFASAMNVHDCHDICSAIEQTIKTELPDVVSVTIHQEPSP